MDPKESLPSVAEKRVERRKHRISLGSCVVSGFVSSLVGCAGR